MAILKRIAYNWQRRRVLSNAFKRYPYASMIS